MEGHCMDIYSWKGLGWKGNTGDCCWYCTLHSLCHVLPIMRFRDCPRQLKGIKMCRDQSCFPLATLKLTKRGRQAERVKATAEGDSAEMSHIYGFSWVCSSLCWSALCSAFPLSQSFLLTATPFFLLVLHSIYLFIFYLLHSSFKLKNNPWHSHDNHIGHTMQLTCALYPFPSACVIPVLVASILWWGLLCPSAVPKIAESGVASSTA